VYRNEIGLLRYVVILSFSKWRNIRK